MENNDKKVLEDLLLDIDILNKLDKWTSKINFFEISGMGNQEIKHSNTLAWFLDSNENHFLKDQVIKRFMQKVVSRNRGINKEIDIFDVSLIDYSTFIVKREWKNIDILLYSEDLKIVFPIENKVYSTESKTQLNKYYKIINDEFKDYKKMFIYLTREGEDPSDMDNWLIADYKMIIDSLEESMNASATIGDKVKIIINDYISMIRRNFGMDNELRKIAQDIYSQHKKAFDLIYEVASTNHAQFSDYIKYWLETNKEQYNLLYDDSYSTSRIIRFRTPFIDEMFPFDTEKGDGWKSGHSFFYEITIQKDLIYIVGVLSNFERPNSQLFVNFSKGSSRGTAWRRVMSGKNILSEEDIIDGLTDEVKEKLNKLLAKAVTKTVYDFEKDVKEFAEKNKDN